MLARFRSVLYNTGIDDGRSRQSQGPSGDIMVSSILLPAGLPLDAASWEQTPLVVRQLVVHLLAITQQQTAQSQTLEARSRALEARLHQRSSNSDRPPSSDPPYEKRPARSSGPAHPGAKPGHLGHRQALLEPTEVIDIKPEACACSQQALPETTPDDLHQVIELPERAMQITHILLHEARCPQCGRLLKAEIPAEDRYGYGPRLTALIAELSGPQRDRRSAVQEFCASVWRVPISRGAIQCAVDRVSVAIQPHYKAMAEQARGAAVHYIDETAWSQHGVLAWLWVMVNTTTAFFSMHASRSLVAFDALVERWAGIWVSDGYGVYQQWAHGRQTCLAHLLRRARGLAERRNPEMARFGTRVMRELQRLVHWATVPPTRGEVQTWDARMGHLLGRSRQRSDAAGTFARTLERALAALWTFGVEEGVEPTHNRAERALRFAVLWRKIVQGTYNEKGDRWVERILALRETCRLRGMPTFPILVEAVTCYFNGQHSDVSWI
jgi:transposase